MMSSARRTSGSDLVGDALALVMAGGSGTRLGPLTRRHAKPALAFGGQYRNVDFTLSNCVNSDIKRIALLTQYKAHSLIQHVRSAWSFLPQETGEFVEVWPAQQRRGEGWYSGTADAVFQNLDLIAEHAPKHVVVLAGDHVYKMDYRPMLEAHARSGALATVACVEVPIAEAAGFGVMGTDAAGWVRRFVEKPAKAEPLPHDPARALASMGIYVFDYTTLVELLSRDANDAASQHDFGRDVLPALIGTGRVLSYALPAMRRGERAYWRDVGTIDSYWQTNLDLLDEHPAIEIDDDSWPIWTYPSRCAPSRFVGEGVAVRSIVPPGCRIAGRVERSVLSNRCRVGAGARVEAAVLLPGAAVGRDCRIRNAVVDAGCAIPDGTVIGHDRAADARCFDVTARGVTLVTADGVARRAALPAAARADDRAGRRERARETQEGLRFDRLAFPA